MGKIPTPLEMVQNAHRNIKQKIAAQVRKVWSESMGQVSVMWFGQVPLMGAVLTRVEDFLQQNTPKPMSQDEVEELKKKYDAAIANNTVDLQIVPKGKDEDMEIINIKEIETDTTKKD